MTTSRRSPTQIRLWGALKISLAVLLAGFVLSQTSLHDLVALWQRISLPWLLGAFVAFWASIWFVTRRYWLLLNRKASLRDMFSLVVWQTVIGNLVATSVGAASYVGALRSRHQIHLSQGIVSLLLARFGDLLALLIALALSATMVWADAQPLHSVIIVLITLMVAAVTLFCSVVAFRQRILVLVEALLRITRLDHFSLVMRLFRGLQALAEHDPIALLRILGPVLIYSVLALWLSFAMAFSIFRVFAVQIEFWQLVLVVSLMQFMTLIPVQVFGGLGIADVTSLYLYGLFGLDTAMIAPAIVGSRIVFYCMNLLLLPYFLIERWLLPAAHDQGASEVGQHIRTGE